MVKNIVFIALAFSMSLILFINYTRQPPFNFYHWRGWLKAANYLLSGALMVVFFVILLSKFIRHSTTINNYYGDN
jgi:hypothetical protein